MADSESPAATASRTSPRDARWPCTPPEEAATAVVDDRGIVTGWTEGAQRLTGYRAPQVVGRPAVGLLATGRRPGAPGLRTAGDWARRLGGRGEWSEIVHVRHRDGRLLRLLAQGKPLIEAEGCARWVVVAQALPEADPERPANWTVPSALLDGSPAVLAQRLNLLSEAGRRIGTTLDVRTTAQELAEFAVPLLADYASVDLSEAVRLDEEPLQRLLATDESVPVFRRAAAASITPGLPESAFGTGEPVFVPPAGPFLRVLGFGESHFEPVMDTSPGTWLDSDPVRADIIKKTGMHSLMIIPLQARGAIVGIATFVRSRNQVPFSRDDLLLAEELVGRSALNVDNAYRYTRERTTALALQKSLLPGNLPQSSAVEVASRYLPADAHAGVGGDWYDVIALPGARVALIVGDVAGHGIHAAATMGRLRTALDTLTDFDLPPHELLARLDAVASRLPEENPDSPVLPGMAATCACAVYNPVTRRCAMARAGHPPPAIVGADGTVDFPDLPSGAPIGLGLGAYESVEQDLPVGSTIVLYTDGLVETRDADFEAGLDRLAAALTGPAPELEELCSEVVDTVVARPSEDDITLLTARTRELGSDRVATWKMSAGPETVGRGRQAAVEQLAAWGLDELADSVRLIVSELVTNAVVHGAEPFALRLIRDSTLVCEVSDTGAGVPRMRRAGAAEESGRGLFVVSELAQRWGSRFISAGKVTWAELALPAGAGGMREQGSAARSG